MLIQNVYCPLTPETEVGNAAVYDDFPQQDTARGPNVDSVATAAICVPLNITFIPSGTPVSVMANTHLLVKNGWPE